MNKLNIQPIKFENNAANERLLNKFNNILCDLEERYKKSISDLKQKKEEIYNNIIISFQDEGRSIFYILDEKIEYLKNDIKNNNDYVNCGDFDDDYKHLPADRIEKLLNKLKNRNIESEEYIKEYENMKQSLNNIIKWKKYYSDKIEATKNYISDLENKIYIY